MPAQGYCSQLCVTRSWMKLAVKTCQKWDSRISFLRLMAFVTGQSPPKETS